MSNRIKRREFLEKSAILTSAAMISGPPLSDSVPAQRTRSYGNNGKKRNVLLIISDDHGIDQLGCYGNHAVKTPRLDAMAANGVRFTNVYSVAASCSASRGSLLTGLYTHQNGQWGHAHNWHHFSLLDWVQTVPSLLRENGYKTGLIGKLHVVSRQNLQFDYVVPGNEIMENRDAKKIAEKAGEFFQMTEDQPFFLLVGYSDPHRADKGVSEMKNVENFSGFANDVKYEGVSPTKFRPEDVLVPGYLPDIPEVREELADQYEAIARMDTSIGWILDNLKTSGKYNDTLVIYLSDNGIPFPGAKTTLYDSGVRMPMIVNSPELKTTGTINDSMISFVDLMPTILDWTETKPPQYKLPGVSFRSVLNETGNMVRTYAFGSHTFHELTMFYPMRSVRTRKYKYILNLYPELEFPFATDLFMSKTWQGILRRKLDDMGERKTRDYLYRPKEELYDIERDPNESINLADNAAQSETLQTLRDALKYMRLETDDYWLINDNYSANTKTFKAK
jgi:N-sulfoglucosamine sulfohydrolase